MNEFQGKLNYLNGIERAMLEMRYSGMSYLKIVEELSEQFGADAPKLSTIKNNFAEGGRLFEIYFEYADSINKNRDREAEVYWRSMILNAVAVVNEIMSDPQNPRRLEAARMVIESLWGKQLPPLKVEVAMTVTNKYANVSTEELRRRLEAIRAEKARISMTNQEDNKKNNLNVSEVANGK